MHLGKLVGYVLITEYLDSSMDFLFRFSKNCSDQDLVSLTLVGAILLIYNFVGLIRLVRCMRQAIRLASDRTSDPIVRVYAAEKIDKEFGEIRSCVLNSWKYRSILTEKLDGHAYGNFYHVYLHPWITQTWNYLRMCQLKLHEIIRDESLKMLGRNLSSLSTSIVQARIRSSEHAIQKICSEICASVPQVMGQIRFPDIPGEEATPMTCIDDFFDPEDLKSKLHPPGTFFDPSRPTGLHELILPLYSVGKIGPRDLKDWAVRQLHFIALRMGTHQALALANELVDLRDAAPAAESEGYINMTRLVPADP